jgi:hypothetical protein
MSTQFRQTEQIFQGIKEFKTASGDCYQVHTDSAPIYRIYELIDGSWKMQGSVKSRSADSALNMFLNRGQCDGVGTC